MFVGRWRRLPALNSDCSGVHSSVCNIHCPARYYSLWQQTTMPEKVIETPYPLIDIDPHASRVMRYMRPSDYAVWAAATAAFPSALYLWGVY